MVWDGGEWPACVWATLGLLAGSKQEWSSAWKVVWHAFAAPCCQPFIMLGPSCGCGSGGTGWLFMSWSQAGGSKLCCWSWAAASAASRMDGGGSSLWNWRRRVAACCGACRPRTCKASAHDA